MSVATFAAAQLLKVLPRVRLSRAVGRLCERPLSPGVSRAVSGVYARAYHVDLDEAEPSAAPYGSFDAFFTRELKRGARAIDAGSVVSPADGRIAATGPVDASARIVVKGQPYDVAELLGDARDAARYSGGAFAVVYLAPRDYHRVHSPVDGVVTCVRGMPGDLFPVNSIGERHFPRLFVRNNRVAIAIDGDRLGRTTVVMVGATIVGRISVKAIPGPAAPPGATAIDPPLPVERGSEIGTFHLGSTAVLLVEPGVALARPVGPVKYGQSLVQAS